MADFDFDRNDVIDIAGRRNEMEEKWNSGDYDALAKMFTNDSAFGPKDTASFSEKVDLNKSIARLGRTALSLYPENITVMKTNEWAMEFGVLTWKEKTPDEKGALERKGKYTLTWTYRDDDWKVFLFMDNSAHAGRQYNQSLLGGNRVEKKD